MKNEMIISQAMETKRKGTYSKAKILSFIMVFAAIFMATFIFGAQSAYAVNKSVNSYSTKYDNRSTNIFELYCKYE